MEGYYGKIDEQVSLSKIYEVEIVNEVDTHKKFSLNKVFLKLINHTLL